jgi:molecular chaperone DnaJ
VADYYQTLGVSRSATTDEIKKAYRRLARELHPDVAGAEGEERFKEVSRAYEVLGTPEKREQYDMGVDPSAPGGGQGGFPGGGPGFGFQDIFETFFGGGQSTSGPIPRARRGQDTLLRMDVDLVEATFGAQKDVELDTFDTCGTCSGVGARPGTSLTTCGTCQGRGHVQRVARSFLGQVMTTQPCPDCQGFGTLIPDPCPECHGDGRVRTRKTIKIQVPAGVDTGTRIRLTGRGEAGPGGGPAADLYVEVRERAHEYFTRQGDDLLCTLEVPMTAAALGTVLSLDTLDGAQDVDIRPGTQPGARVTLKGLGVAHLHRGGRGDLHVTVDVHVPTGLDHEQSELLRALAKARGEEAPEPRLAPTGGGVFSKLRDKLAGK